MPLGNFLGPLPWPFWDMLIRVAGFMGALALGYGVLLETEKNQDAVFVVASASLFVYALFINNHIFMLAMALMFAISARELIQIMRGQHHHTTTDIQKYDHIDGK